MGTEKQQCSEINSGNMGLKYKRGIKMGKYGADKLEIGELKYTKFE